MKFAFNFERIEPKSEKVDIEYLGSDGNLKRLSVSSDEIFEISKSELKTDSLLFSSRGCYKSLVRGVEEGDHEIIIRSLPFGPLGWWHHERGITDASLSRGEGIRLGIIDYGLRSQNPESCISHVRNLNGSSRSEFIISLHTDHPEGAQHSQAVCSLIGSRCKTDKGFQGVAPGANIYFWSAGNEINETLDSARVAIGIDWLSDEYNCHLISVSAGLLNENNKEGMIASIEEARRNGTVCVFAAGNSGDQCYFPARNDECIGVSAIGKRKTAPPATDLYFLEKQDSKPLDDSSLFMLNSSANGTGVDYVDVGVGLVFNEESESHSAVYGTSYAAPVFTAIAGISLVSDTEFVKMKPSLERVDFAEKYLSERARTLYFPENGKKIASKGMLAQLKSV